MIKRENTDWIYGLKLVAAILVVVHHFALFFYPALVTGATLDVRTSTGIETALAKTPFDIFSWGGNVCVCIFFIISGFLISYKFFFKKGKINYQKSFVTRYFKLAIPMLLTALIYFIVLYLIQLVNHGNLCFSVLGMSGSYCNFNNNIFYTIYEATIGFFWNGSVAINSVLWTMKGELIGSFAILAFLYFFGQNKNRKYIYVIATILLSQTIVFPFLLGMVLCDAYQNECWKKWLEKWYIKLILILTGLYFCGFTFVALDTNWYSFLTTKLVDANIFYHTIGSFLVIVAIINSNKMKKILSKKPILKHKNLSFEIYLFHWLVINTVSFILMNYLIKYLDYKYAFLITFIISIILIVSISIFIGERILNFTSKTTEKIYQKYFKNENP